MAKKYYESFNNLNSSYKNILFTHLKKRGFYNLEILFKWKEIVGEDLSALYIPHSVKQSYSKKNSADDNQKPNAQILYVVPKNGKDFYKFAYYKSQFMERLSFFFGVSPFKDIKCNPLEE